MPKTKKPDLHKPQMKPQEPAKKIYPLKRTFIGRGNFATVYRVEKMLIKGELIGPVAEKEGHPDPFNGNPELEEEAIIYKKISYGDKSHPNIIQLLESSEYNCSQFRLILELADMNLSEYLYKNKDGDRDEMQCKKFAEQMTMGVDYLHKNKIVHMDLNPGNILIKNGQVKITDFNSSMDLKRYPCITHMRGTYGYMAPEIEAANEKNLVRVNASADIWGLTVCLYLLATPNEYAYQGGASIPTWMLYMKSFLCCSATTTPIEKLLIWGFNTNPDNRPTAEEILHTLPNLPRFRLS